MSDYSYSDFLKEPLDFAPILKVMSDRLVLWKSVMRYSKADHHPITDEEIHMDKLLFDE